VGYKGFDTVAVRWWLACVVGQVVFSVSTTILTVGWVVGGMFGGRSWRVVLLVCVVVLAGCSGFYDERDPPGESTVVSGPDGGGSGMQAGEPTTAADETAVAPGVTKESGLVNESALLTSHRRALVAGGFRYAFTHRMVERLNDSGTVTESVEWDVAGVVAAEAELSRHRRVREERAGSVTARIVKWGNGSVAVARNETAGEMSYPRYTGGVSDALATHYMMGSLVPLGNWTVASVRKGGDEVVLVANGTNPARNAEGVRRYEGRMVVSASGVVQSLNLTVATLDPGEYGDSQYSVRTRTLTYDLQATDGVSVERPSWVAAAVNASA
jgi:hypothetical protein